MRFILPIPPLLPAVYKISLLLVVAMSMAACGNKKNVTDTREPLKGRSSGFLLKKQERNEFSFDWVGMKLDAQVKTMGETQDFKATIRMKKDSVIWISISPALGIEVFRVLVTPDSVKYLSKIPDNKFYYIGGFDGLSSAIKLDMDFRMLQDLLLGNAIGLDREEGKFRSEIDDYHYLLISKYKRKVRRVVGIDDRHLQPEDTIVVNPNDPRYQRTMRRTEDEDLIITRYWLEPENFRLVKSIFNDLTNQRTVEINYSNFAQEDIQFYPKECSIKTKTKDSDQEINFEILRLATDKTYEFPFEIPEGLERKKTM
jgi:hypothetical protein